MALGWDDVIIAGLMVGEWAYFRWFSDTPKPPPASEIAIPRTDAGAPYAMAFGRVRVNAPVVAWASDPVATYQNIGDSDLGFPSKVAAWYYMLDQFLVVAIGFQDGQNHLYTMWSGETQMIRDGLTAQLGDLTGDGGPESEPPTNRVADVIPPTTVQADFTTIGAGSVEFLNGKSTQDLINPIVSSVCHTDVGNYMTRTTTSAGTLWGDLNGTIDNTSVPGYRGFLSVFHWNTMGIAHWMIGTNPNVPQYSYEIGTYPATPLGPNLMVDAGGGPCEANPADVLWDVITATFGKLGLDPSLLDKTSFQTAATTLDSEGYGYSRSFEQGATAAEIIAEICEHIDGGIRENPSTGLIELKLARADYTPSALLQINPGNCRDIVNFGASGMSDVANKIRVGFKNRLDGYRDDSATAQNTANALAQIGAPGELKLSYPGCCTAQQATMIAGRELAARCRPMMKLRAYVNRTFRNIMPLDVVRVAWPEKYLSNVVFRVAAVPSRGTLDKPEITLDLIEDYFYVWRSRPPISGISIGGGFGVGLRH